MTQQQKERWQWALLPGGDLELFLNADDVPLINEGANEGPARGPARKKAEKLAEKMKEGVRQAV